MNISSFMASGVGMDASLLGSDGCINSKPGCSAFFLGVKTTIVTGAPFWMK